MNMIITRLGLTVPSKLGTCGFCMRSAFASAALFWLGAIVSSLAAPFPATIGLATIAGLLSALWIAHLIAHSSRAVAGRPTQADAVDEGRRGLVTAFARAFVFAAAATAVPAGLARAEECRKCAHTYSCLDANGNVPCCPQSTPYLCTTDCKCYADTSTCNSTYHCVG